MTDVLGQQDTTSAAPVFTPGCSNRECHANAKLPTHKHALWSLTRLKGVLTLKRL